MRGQSAPVEAGRTRSSRRAMRRTQGATGRSRQRMRNPTKTSDPGDRDARADLACRRRISIATEAPGLLSSRSAAAPRLVAGDVRVLRLERLVARPWPPRAGVADDRSGRRRPAHSSMLIGPTVALPYPLASSRSRTAAWTSAALAWPRVAFMTWPTRKPIACSLPAR